MRSYHGAVARLQVEFVVDAPLMMMRVSLRPDNLANKVAISPSACSKLSTPPVLTGRCIEPTTICKSPTLRKKAQRQKSVLVISAQWALQCRSTSSVTSPALTFGAHGLQALPAGVGHRVLARGELLQAQDVALRRHVQDPLRWLLCDVPCGDLPKLLFVRLLIAAVVEVVVDLRASS